MKLLRYAHPQRGDGKIIIHSDEQGAALLAALRRMGRPGYIASVDRGPLMRKKLKRL